jgi:hypothetical protein
MVVKTPDSVVPKILTVPTITTAIKEAINAYSIAVTASSCLRNLRTEVFKINENSMMSSYKKYFDEIKTTLTSSTYF